MERDMRNSDNPVDSMLSVHAALELGIDTSEVEGAAPTRAALFSFGTFSVGAAIPMLPWLVVQILNRRAPSAGIYVFGVMRRLIPSSSPRGQPSGGHVNRVQWTYGTWF